MRNLVLRGTVIPLMEDFTVGRFTLLNLPDGVRIMKGGMIIATVWKKEASFKGIQLSSEVKDPEELRELYLLVEDVWNEINKE